MAFLDEEIRCDFKVSTNRKLLWKKEIDLLKWLEGVCEKEKLDYFLIAGSEIGVIRHSGFIPWDDDIDIGMLRVNFDKFLKVYKEYLPKEYEVQFGLDEQNGVWSSLIRIRDNNSTGIINNQIGKNISHGVFIEIYCFDFVPEKKNKQKKLARKASGYLLVLQDKIGQIPAKGKRAILLKLLYRRLSTKDLVDKIDVLCRSIPKSNCVSTIMLPKYLAEGTEVFDFVDVEKTISLPFEYITARVPIGYDNCLTREFGDYLTLPPINERGIHHSTKVFYDASKPYTEYKEESMQELFDKYGFLL